MQAVRWLEMFALCLLYKLEYSDTRNATYYTGLSYADL